LPHALLRRMLGHPALGEYGPGMARSSDGSAGTTNKGPRHRRRSPAGRASDQETHLVVMRWLWLPITVGTRSTTLMGKVILTFNGSCGDG
jgi:hypothetical protein